MILKHKYIKSRSKHNSKFRELRLIDSGFAKTSYALVIDLSTCKYIMGHICKIRKERKEVQLYATHFLTNLGVEVLETRQHLQRLIHQSINVSQVLHSDVPLTFSLEKSKVNIFRANLTLYITVCFAGFHERSSSKAQPTKIQNQYPLKSY